ncbi:hypothetical protein GCM10009678_15130 [Actinomadura kijaniata]|uniref:PH domain-containing protein n=1 Tax=Actinomadura namibiensis TaxID=182080 RepID=A0A7W3QML0_ACTNM|nr:DivIVA domain-containing protein [Actinomadura namibiensis]MBA8952679.1 hypothetical protein [Actinomadura namibiensis]
MDSPFFTEEPAPGFDIRWRGYDRVQVDDYLRGLTKRRGLRSETPPPSFELVLRGYDQDQVDSFIQRLSQPWTRAQETASRPLPVPGGEITGADGWEYRLPRSAFIPGAIGMGVPVLAGACVAGTSDDNPPALRVLLFVLMTGGLTLFLWSAWRSGTYVSRQGIVTYGMLRRTETRWRDIQGISRKQSLSTETAVIYTRQGKELKLHQLHSRNFLVEHEVLVLRAIWEQRRGSGWKPIPEVVAEMKHRTLS